MSQSDRPSPNTTSDVSSVLVTDPERESLLPSDNSVMELLRGVIDPELGSDIVELGMAKGASVAADGRVSITIALTTSGCPLRAQIQKDVKARVASLPGVTSVKIEWTELNDEEKRVAMERARFNASSESEAVTISPTTKVIAIASGKGGVGKSAVTANLAAALANRGLAVGVLDADIWGFSIPRMLGVDGRLGAKLDGERRLMVPHRLKIGEGSLEIASMGLLVDDEEDALMWRGLMLNRAVQHFLEDVDWGDLDYLLIDMPPGTGDVQMGLARMLPRAEMIIVTTPATSAQKVAIRAATMARKSHLRVAGVVENMSSFVTPSGEEFAIFGSGGGEVLARDAGVPLLAKIPIDTAVAAGSDSGQPIALGEGPAADAFRAFAEIVVNEAVPPIDLASCSARLMDAMTAALDAADTA